ncbi:hypothetical protein ACQEVM_36090 [Streptomyces sp. CA-243310]
MRGRLGFSVLKERDRVLDAAEVDQVDCESVAVGRGVVCKDGKGLLGPT